MLNSNNERELAYLTIVDSVHPMNADRLEYVCVGGWHCVVGKGEFKPGDVAVYFGIDSQLPDISPFSSIEFLKSKHFKIKSQKIRGEISQGLLLPLNVFGWDSFTQISTNKKYVKDDTGSFHYIDDDSRFLTKQLNVTYATSEDNKRKASPIDKYKKMSQRYPHLGKKNWWRWLYKREWGKKVLFFFFGKPKDRKNGWPTWVKKTDEERCQNMPWLFTLESSRCKNYIATEKIDGTSTTFTMKGFGRKRQFLVCSRNVVFTKPNADCYYKENVYQKMAEKYHIEEVLSKLLDNFKNEESQADFITLQGETFGAGIQKRDYGLKDPEIRFFNVIFGYKNGKTVRLNPVQGTIFLQKYNLPFVPIIDEHFKLPETCEELLEKASGISLIDGGLREGLVLRTEDGSFSFKAVSNDYLLKYHS